MSMGNQSFPIEYGPYTLHRSIAHGMNTELFYATIREGGTKELIASKFPDPDAGFLLKRLLPSLSHDQEQVNTFLTEIKISARFDHPNICKIYDYGCVDGAYYMVMEYINGNNLREILEGLGKKGMHIPLPVMFYIASQVLSGLNAAHTLCDEQNRPLNIVHRDITPHNILIGFNGDVKLIDFGIANATIKNEHTRQGVIKGKLCYMAPEQALGRQIDHRADIYALGIILYEMLTGRLPTDSDNQYETYQKVISSAFPPIERVCSLPPRLCQIVDKALENNPDNRYLTTLQFKKDLDAFFRRLYPGFDRERFMEYIQIIPSESMAQQRENHTFSNLATLSFASHPAVLPEMLKRRPSKMLGNIIALSLGTVLAMLFLGLVLMVTT